MQNINITCSSVHSFKTEANVCKFLSQIILQKICRISGYADKWKCLPQLMLLIWGLHFKMLKYSSINDFLLSAKIL